MGWLRHPLQRLVSATRRPREADPPDLSDPDPDRPPGQVLLDLTGMPDLQVQAMAVALMAAAVQAQGPVAAELHRAAREVHEVYVQRAERQVVRTAENWLQVRTWRVAE